MYIIKNTGKVVAAPKKADGEASPKSPTRRHRSRKDHKPSHFSPNHAPGTSKSDQSEDQEKKGKEDKEDGWYCLDHRKSFSI